MKDHRTLSYGILWNVFVPFLYFQLPLLKHLVHQPLDPSLLFPKVEKILVIFFRKTIAVVCIFLKDKGNLPQISYKALTVLKAELLKQKLYVSMIPTPVI